MEIAEYENGSLARRYIPGHSVDQRVAKIENDGSDTTHFYHANRLGSVQAVVNASGVVTDKYIYTPFGVQEIFAADSDINRPSGNPFRYTGRRYDVESGLYYYRARYYDSELGRFLETDPVGYADQMNMYTYVANDPLSYTDPNGMEAIILQRTFARIGPLRADHQALLLSSGENGGYLYINISGGKRRTNSLKFFRTRDEALRSKELSRYTRAYSTTTNPDQDAKIFNIGRSASKKRYIVLYRNCGDMVHDALEAADIHIEDTFNPAATEDVLVDDENWEDATDELLEAQRYRTEAESNSEKNKENQKNSSAFTVWGNGKITGQRSSGTRINKDKIKKQKEDNDEQN